MSTYPDHPGSYPVDTSEQAADAVAPDAQRLRDACLAALRERGPLTADEVAEAIGVSVLSARPRVTELKMAGLVSDTGKRRANVSGRSAAVMEAVRMAPRRYEQAEMSL